MKLYAGTDEPPGLRSWCAQHPGQDPPNVYQSVQGDGPNVYLWRCAGVDPIMYPDPNYDATSFDEAGFAKSSWQTVPDPAGH